MCGKHSGMSLLVISDEHTRGDPFFRQFGLHMTDYEPKYIHFITRNSALHAGKQEAAIVASCGWLREHCWTTS